MSLRVPQYCGAKQSREICNGIAMSLRSLPAGRQARDDNNKYANQRIHRRTT